MPGRPKKVKHLGLFSRDNQPKQQTRTESQASLDNSSLSEKYSGGGVRVAPMAKDLSMIISFTHFLIKVHDVGEFFVVKC